MTRDPRREPSRDPRRDAAADTPTAGGPVEPADPSTDAPLGARLRPCRLRVCGMHPAHQYVQDGEAYTCPGSAG